MSAVAFLVVLITVGFVSHSYVQRNMTQELRDDIQTRWSLFAAEYQAADAGVATVVKLVESATSFTHLAERAIGLFDPAGTPIAGNISALPDGAGWQQGSLGLIAEKFYPPMTGPSADYIYLCGPLGGYTLVVGQRTDQLVRINRSIFRTLAITGVVVVLAMLCVGYFLSRNSLHKLERLEATLAQVSDGDMTARTVISSQNDQIDRIAARINVQLDTLSRLMMATRTTAAAVAHDLKSPLARAYMALGQALARVAAGQNPQAEIEDTQAELERMNGIFDVFLRLSRIEAGADGVRFAKVDLAPLLDDLAETYQMVAEDSGQTLVYQRPEGGRFTVTGDASMLQQMIVNLLQNAVTHGGTGCEIRVRLDNFADHVRLTVADTGPGIPEAARQAVFEPFHRLDPSRNRPGNGLGLALVRAIAERHNARVLLSDNAPGLRVVVEFPASGPTPHNV